MKILVISQYFWPESFRVNDLCVELQNRGNCVSVLTGLPNYPSGKLGEGYGFFNKNTEIWNEIKIYRTWVIPRGNGSGLMLSLNYLSFAIFASFRLLFIKAKFDKILVYQLSPATIGLPGLIASKLFKAPMYFYIQDLWPESLTDAGNIKSNLILKLVNRMMVFYYDNSKKILVQSKGFINYLINKGISKDKIVYLPNTVESYYVPIEKNDRYKKYFPSGFNIIFAGNIGFAQDFETIISAACILKNKNININWIIIGEGRGKNKILELIKIYDVYESFYFLGSFPSTEMPYFFSFADVMLVSLKDSLIFSLTIPSKLQSYLACGKPILGNISGIGENIILESKSGLSSNPGDPESLAKNCELLFNCTKNQLDIYSENAYSYYMKEFERNLVYSKLIKILNSDNDSI